MSIYDTLPATSFMRTFLNETKKSIDNGMHGNDILSDAIKATTNFKDIDSLVDAMIVDATDNVTAPGDWQSDSWATYDEDRATLNLAENFGIIFDDVDTGAVIGLHNGGETAYNAENIVPESGSITGTLQPTPSEEPVTKYFKNSEGKIVPVSVIWKTDKLYLIDPADDEADVDDAEGRDLSELTDEQRTAFNTIVESLDRWWIVQACSLNDYSYGLSMENATLKMALVSSSTDEDLGFTAATSPKDENGVIDMFVNFDVFDSIDSSDVNGNTDDSSEQLYLDRTIAHEMTHAAMFYHDLFDLDDNDNDSYLPGQYTEGIADFTHGGDDSNAYNKYELTDLAGHYNSLKRALNLVSGTGEENFYTAGYMMMRYLTKQATDGESANFAISDDFTVRNVHDEMYLTKTGTQNALNDSVVGQFNVKDDVINYSAIATLEAQNITINGANKWGITSTDNDDTLTVVNEYSTLNGQSSYSDVTVVSGTGNDLISNYGGYNSSIVSGEGNDSIFNRHGYYATIEAGEGNDFVNISNGNYQYIGSGEGNDTIMATIASIQDNDWGMGGFATLLGGAGNDLIDPIYTNDAYISGGDGDDTIITDGDNTTIDAGAGVDFIKLENIGSTSEATFILTGVTEADSLMIDEEILKAASVGSVTIKRNGEIVTVSGEGDWTINDNTITLSNTSSLRSGESGLEVYDSGMAAYEGATLNNNEVQYDNGDSDVNLTFTQKGAAIIGNSATGDKIITANNEGNTLKNYSSKANVTMIGGAGDDYIVAVGGKNEIIELSRGGKDTVLAIDGASVKGYDATTGAMFQTDIETTENIIDAIMNGNLYVNGNYFGPSRDKRVNLIDYDYSKGTFVKLRTLDGDEQLFAWSPQNGGQVDGSDYTKRQIIFGIAPDGKSTLKGGKSSDTIYASLGDTIHLSQGNDLIYIDRRNSNYGAAVIDLENSERGTMTTIEGFNTKSDRIISSQELNKVRIDNAGNIAITIDDKSHVDIEKGYESGELKIDNSGYFQTVREIDLSGRSSNSTIIGNSMENVITASSGKSSLWGGEGNESDTLVGSDGYNEFFYLKGNGNDLISGAKDTDLINLLNINLDDISATEFNGLILRINFKDGGSLTTGTFGDLTFQLADGSKWQSHQMLKTWTKK